MTRLDDGPVPFTPVQRQIVAGLIRQDLRKLDKSRSRLREKLGEHYDPTKQDPREAALESAYRLLGGDPRRITGRQK